MQNNCIPGNFYKYRQTKAKMELRSSQSLEKLFDAQYTMVFSGKMTMALSSGFMPYERKIP